VEPLRRAAAVLPAGVTGGLDPTLAVVTVGGVAALVASTREAARPFAGETPDADAWRQHVLDLLVHGLSRGNGAAPSAGANGTHAPEQGAKAAAAQPS
jgi:hypothetical protein